jgi:hypothetical protein
VATVPRNVEMGFGALSIATIACAKITVKRSADIFIEILLKHIVLKHTILMKPSFG